METLNTLADWLIAALQDFKTEGMIDKITFLAFVVGLILAPFGWLWW